MELKYMEGNDKAFVMSIDTHVNEEQYANRVLTKSGYVIWDGDEPVGLMHHAVLWDNLPFLNLIYIREECRGKGYGTAMLALALLECRKKGIFTVHICPSSTENKSAIQTILNNNGYFLDEFTDDDRIIPRYEIILN